MKIALLHPAFGAWGGAENVVLWEAQGLRERGHDVTVLAASFSERALTLFAEAGVTTRRLRFMDGRAWTRLQIGGGGVRMLAQADHVVRLDRASMRRGAAGLARDLAAYDGVNVHNFPATWWLHEAQQAAGNKPFPRVVWYCEEPPRTLYPGLFDGDPFAFAPDGSALQAHDREVGASLTRIACNSRYVRDRVAAIYGRPDAECLYLGIPPPPGGPRAWGTNDGLDVLMVTRLVEAKNVACAIEAVARVEGARLRIAGTGPQRADLERLIEARGVASRVKLLGFVPDDEMPALYRSADAFIFLPIGEPFGLVLLEAAWAGVPCVTSNHGGPSEIVLNGETGWLVDPRSVEEVADALRRMLADAATGGLGESPLARMGMAARARVEKTFSLSRCVDGMEALLNDGDGG